MECRDPCAPESPFLGPSPAAPLPSSLPLSFSTTFHAFQRHSCLLSSVTHLGLTSCLETPQFLRLAFQQVSCVRAYYVPGTSVSHKIMRLRNLVFWLLNKDNT